jgi:photosystem II stability/assembly factor-like uncharacterized protein
MGESPAVGVPGGGARSVTAPQPAKVTGLAFRNLPITGLVGAPLSKFFVDFVDAQGRVVPAATDSVVVEVDNGPSGARLVGFPRVEARDGSALFETVGMDRPGTYWLSAVATGLQVQASASIDVSAPAFINLATSLAPQTIYSVLPSARGVLYASTDQGVVRSDSAGASWRLVSFVLQKGVGELRAIPSEGDTIVYAAGGSENHFGFDFLGRTQDGGATWRSLPAPALDAGPVRDVALDPARPNSVWACGSGGVYASEDAGEHWVKTAFEGQCGALVFGGPPPGALFGYHAELSTRTLLKSNTSGATWQAVRSLDNELTGLFAASSGALYTATGPALERSDNGGATWSSAAVAVTHLASSAENPLRLYAVTDKRVRVSVDGGSTFSEGTDLRPWDILGLAADPSDALHVYAATSGGLLASTDGGVTWASPSTGLANASDVVVHPAQPARVFAASGSGVYRSDDGGDSWRLLQDGPTSVGRLAFDPADASVAYACGTNFYGSSDGGDSWQVLSASGDCGAFAIAGSQLWRGGPYSPAEHSVDGGVTWVPAGLSEPALALTASLDGMTVYAGTNAGTFRSVDAGGNWTLVDGTAQLQVMAIDPLEPNRVWGGDCGIGAGGLRLSSNAGVTWNEVTTFPGACARAMRLASDGTSYVMGDQIYLSNDAGRTWSATSLSGVLGLSRYALAVSSDRTTLFVATDRGLFRSARGGQ